MTAPQHPLNSGRWTGYGPLLGLSLLGLGLTACPSVPAPSPPPPSGLPSDSDPDGEMETGEADGMMVGDLRDQDGAPSRVGARKLAASPDHAEADLPPPDPTDGAFSVVSDELKSRFAFSATTQGGENITARMNRVIGGLYLTAGDLSTTRGTLSIDLRELDSGDAVQDSQLSQIFFEVQDLGSPLAHLEIRTLRPKKRQLQPGERCGIDFDYGLGLPQGAVEGKATGELYRLDANRWELRLPNIPASIAAVGMNKQNDKLGRSRGGQALEDLLSFSGTIVLMSRPTE